MAMYLLIGGIKTAGNLAGGNRKQVIGVNNEEDLEAAIGVGLGELAEITVNNDAEPGNYDVGAKENEVKEKEFYELR